MDDVQGLFLGMPHSITPAAVTSNKNIIMSSFKSSGYIQKKEGGSDSPVCVGPGRKPRRLVFLCHGSFIAALLLLMIARCIDSFLLNG